MSTCLNQFLLFLAFQLLFFPCMDHIFLFDWYIWSWVDNSCFQYPEKKINWESQGQRKKRHSTHMTVGTFNPHWHEQWKQEKCSFLPPPRGICYKPRWAWQDVKLTRLMSIFTSKKVWKFLIKIQLTKSDPKRTRGGKCPPSCQLGLRCLQKDLSPMWKISKGLANIRSWSLNMVLLHLQLKKFISANIFSTEAEMNELFSLQLSLDN